MRAKYLGAVLAAIAALPLVAARDLNLGFGSGGISNAISRIYEFVAAFFNVPMSPTVLQGLMKFLFFLLIFSVSFWAFRRTVFRDGNGANDGLNRKTAGIIALTFALISVWFIPGALFVDLTSIIPALFTLVLILFIPAICIAIAFGIYSFREGNNQQPTLTQHALGALLVGFAWGYTIFWYEVIGRHFAPGQFNNIIDIALAWMLVALPIMFIVKLVQLALAGFQNAGGAGGGGADDGHGWLGRFARRTADQVNSLRDSWRRFRTVPTIISNVNFEQVGPNSIRVFWDALPNEENILRYEIRWSSLDLNAMSATRRNLNLNVPSDPRILTLEPVNHPLHERVFNNLPVANPMLFAVRAVNNTNTSGMWGLSPFKRPRDPVVNAPNYTAQLDAADDAVHRARGSLQAAQQILQRRNILDAAGALTGVYAFATVAELDAVLNHIADATTYCGQADAALNAIRADGRYLEITVAQRIRMLNIDTDIAEVLDLLVEATGGSYALIV